MICPRFQTVCALDACAERGCVDIPVVTRAVPEAPADVYSVLGHTWAEARNLLALIERLAPDDPLDGANVHGWCFFCGARSVHPTEPFHDDDCPWVEARRVLGK